MVCVVRLLKGGPGAQNKQDMKLQKLPRSIQAAQSLVAALLEGNLDILITSKQPFNFPSYYT